MQSETVTAKDIAIARGWSYLQAWRWLRTIEAEYGPRVVGRRGRRMWTTRRALAEIAPSVADARERATITDLQDRVDRLESELREFRRKSHEQLTKPGKR